MGSGVSFMSDSKLPFEGRISMNQPSCKEISRNNEIDKVRPESFSISDEALDQVSMLASYSSEMKSVQNLREQLLANEEMWIKKYLQVEKCNKINEHLNINTFNSLCDSLTNYLLNKDRSIGEEYKDKVIDCYSNKSNGIEGTLECSNDVNNFSNWLVETRRGLLDKDSRKTLSIENDNIT